MVILKLMRSFRIILDKVYDKISYIIDLQNSIHESKEKKRYELIYKNALEKVNKEEIQKK